MHTLADMAFCKHAWPAPQPSAPLAVGEHIVPTLAGATWAGLFTVAPQETGTAVRALPPQLGCDPVGPPSASQPPVTFDVTVTVMHPPPILTVSEPWVQGFEAGAPQVQSHAALADVGGGATTTGVS